MIKFEKIVAGMILYDVRKANWRTRMFSKSKWDFWTVKVIEVNTENRTVFASWNHTKERGYSERQITGYRASLPKEEN